MADISTLQNRHSRNNTGGREQGGPDIRLGLLKFGIYQRVLVLWYHGRNHYKV